jgi:hypothetical protein
VPGRATLRANHGCANAVQTRMARSKTKSRKHAKAAPLATLAQSLAPDDIRPGDHVAVLHEVWEYPSWFWCDDSALADRAEVVRVCYTPREDAAPLAVRAVCLPFVLVREPCGRERTLDVRRCRLARLDSSFATAAAAAFRKAAKRRGGRRSTGRV